MCVSTSDPDLDPAGLLLPGQELELTSPTACINDDFICGLFDIIEQVSDDVNDPYHYPVIRVLVSTISSQGRNIADRSIACVERTIHGCCP